MKKILFIIASLIAFPQVGQAQQKSSTNIELMQINSSILDQQIVPKDMDLLTFFQNYDQSRISAPPINNNCANALNIPIGTTLLGQTTVEATLQPGEHITYAPTSTQSVWYKFVATGTNHVVSVSLVTSSGCYFSSAVWPTVAGCVPTGVCMPISSQSAAYGPLVQDHVLTQLVIGQTYFVQVLYTRAPGVCGNAITAGANFSIGVSNTPIMLFPSNPAPLSTCQAPPGPSGIACVFGTPPTIPQVTSTCPTYFNPVLGPSITNEVVRACFTISTGLFNTSIAVQNIISSNCGVGTVSWFYYTIYDASCQVVACGDLNNLVASNLACGTPYIFCLMYEIPNCTHFQFYPYVNSNNVACSPLPIVLLNFEAKVEEGSVRLLWQTASEQDNDYFVIEKSVDGISFEEAVRLPGAGNTSTGATYQTMDFKPYLGVSYYRLRQVDIDGTSVVSSKTVSVNLKRSLNQEFSFENSEQGFSFESDVDGKFFLFSVEGKILMQFDVSKGKQTLDLHTLSSGFYVYQFVTGEGKVFKGKIVK